LADPTEGTRLKTEEEEVPIGKGKVDFPRIIARFERAELGGAESPERGNLGPRQLEDVRTAKAYLEKTDRKNSYRPTGRQISFQFR